MARASLTLVAATTLAFAGTALLASGPVNRAAPGRPPQRAREPAAMSASDQRSLLDTYCVTCHNQRLKTAGLALDAVDVARVGSDAETFEKVVRKLRAGVMPPAAARQPHRALVRGFVGSLEAALDRAAAAAPRPGRPAMHRLNRAEYANVIRDVLALDVDAKALLPADDSGYGFDNIADLLTMSPGLLDRYLLAAKKVSRAAVGDPTLRPSVAVYELPYLTLEQKDRMSEDLPLGSRGGTAIRHYFPLDGEYLIKIRAQRSTLSLGGQVRGLDVDNQVDVRLDGARLQLLTLAPRTYTTGLYTDSEDLPDEGLQVRATVKAGLRVVGVTLNRHPWYVEGVGMSRLPPASSAHAEARVTDERHGKIDMGIEKVEISGPFNGKVPEDTPARRRIFVCRPPAPNDDEPCATTILSTIVQRAYRRPPADEDLRTLLGFYRAGRADGGFERGIQRALERILADPDFLFRTEREQAGLPPASTYRISDVELASRLSFFLWSSGPDDELLGLAARGALKRPDVLEQQVRRMIADSRSTALVDNFFGQWLYVRNLAARRPDPSAFPEFDENLREAFRRETELFLGSQLREDRAATELLTANYTFVNERLARHYAIPRVYGSHFRRIAFADDRRAGLLGHGSLLMVTSYENRTSPVLRGKWLLENLLGTPAPPPPPNVPPFPEQERTRHTLSVRARMEQHRKNPVCAACHSMLDPLGFALENFDTIGRWRTHDGPTPIDASGALPDGTAFAGPAEFRRAVLAHQDEFLLNLTGKLLTYALGRGIEHQDMPAVRRIVRESASSDHRWSALILNIVTSMPFQMRSSAS